MKGKRVHFERWMGGYVKDMYRMTMWLPLLWHCVVVNHFANLHSRRGSGLGGYFFKWGVHARLLRGGQWLRDLQEYTRGDSWLRDVLWVSRRVHRGYCSHLCCALSLQKNWGESGLWVHRAGVREIFLSFQVFNDVELDVVSAQYIHCAVGFASVRVVVDGDFWHVKSPFFGEECLKGSIIVRIFGVKRKLGADIECSVKKNCWYVFW